MTSCWVTVRGVRRTDYAPEPVAEPLWREAFYLVRAGRRPIPLVPSPSFALASELAGCAVGEGGTVEGERLRSLLKAPRVGYRRPVRTTDPFVKRLDGSDRLSGGEFGVPGTVNVLAA
jgi:hypothetical protein